MPVSLANRRNTSQILLVSRSRPARVACWRIVRGVGRDYPWSIEKLSPTLAFFVVDGVKQGADRCHEILQFGGMGHTAGMHTQNREAADQYGEQMPAARVVINSPTTHGAIGFSTDLRRR